MLTSISPMYSRPSVMKSRRSDSSWTRSFPAAGGLSGAASAAGAAAGSPGAASGGMPRPAASSAMNPSMLPS